MEASPKPRTDTPDLDRFEAVRGDLSKSQRAALKRYAEEALELYEAFEDSPIEDDDLLYGIADGLEIADRNWGESRPDLVLPSVRIHLERIETAENHREAVDAIDMDSYWKAVFGYWEDASKTKRPPFRRRVPSVEVQRVVTKSLREVRHEARHKRLKASAHEVAIIMQMPRLLKERLPMLTEQIAGASVALSHNHENEGKLFTPVLSLNEEQQIDFFKRVIMVAANDVAKLKASQEQWAEEQKRAKKG